MPFDHRLLRLMNEHFTQETPLLDVATFDALPEAWSDADRQTLPDTNPARRLAIGQHYGLTAPPLGAGDFPLGLVPGTMAGRPMLRANCLICHAGELFGQPVIGVANTRLDFEALMDDLIAVSAARGHSLGPFGRFYRISKRYGIGFGTTIGSTAPLTFAALFMATRHPDLTTRQTPESLLEMAEGSLAAPLAQRFGAEAGAIAAAEEFVRHLDKVELPASYAQVFPERVARERAAAGQILFARHCAECHGTYAMAPAADDYPGRVVPVDAIGTDPVRARGIALGFRQFLAHSWFASPGTVRGADEPPGYRAPYLRRVAYTFPYFHNGSVPTLRHVLFPDERPDQWLIAPEHFDHERIGQWVDALPLEADGPPPPARQIFDTTLPGKRNGGHDRMLPPLSPADRTAILEYLKTL